MNRKQKRKDASVRRHKLTVGDAIKVQSQVDGANKTLATMYARVRLLEQIAGVLLERHEGNDAMNHFVVMPFTELGNARALVTEIDSKSQILKLRLSSLPRGENAKPSQGNGSEDNAATVGRSNVGDGDPEVVQEGTG